MATLTTPPERSMIARRWSTGSQNSLSRKRPTDAPARRRTTSRPALASTLLRGVLEGSEQLGQPSAAIQATQLSAKPVGLLVDRKESGAPGDFAAVAVQRPRWRSVSSFAR